MFVYFYVLETEYCSEEISYSFYKVLYMQLSQRFQGRNYNFFEVRGSGAKVEHKGYVMA